MRHSSSGSHSDDGRGRHVMSRQEVLAGTQVGERKVGSLVKMLARQGYGDAEMVDGVAAVVRSSYFWNNQASNIAETLRPRACLTNGDEVHHDTPHSFSPA